MRQKICEDLRTASLNQNLLDHVKDKGCIKVKGCMLLLV